MSDPPDMDSLARRYLDLWQQGVSQAAADPDAARAMAAFFAQLRAFMPSVPAAESERGGETDGVAGALTRIEQRLGRIEERLAALETPRGTRPAKPRSATPRNTSRATGRKT